MQSELPEDAGVRDGRAQWELGGWLQPQTPIALDTLTLSIRLQSTLYEGIRTEGRCCHELSVIRRRRCPLLDSTEPQCIRSPVDQAKQSTSWDGIMGRFVAGCPRGTCILIYMGANNQYEPRRSNAIHLLYLATKESMQHYSGLAAILKHSMRIMICS